MTRPTLLLVAALAAAPVLAQTSGPAMPKGDPMMKAQERVSSLMECEKPTRASDIVVCARRRSQQEPFRLPIREEGFDKDGNVLSVSRERNALLDETGGGIGTCTNVGPGGSGGCFVRDMKRGREQRGGE